MNNQNIKIFLLVLVSIFILNCKSIMKKENNITFQLKETTEKLYNNDKTLLLILTYKIDGNLPITFNYKVIDVKTKIEKKAGVFTGTKIVWQDNLSLKCTKYIGMVENENEDPLKQIKKTKNYIIINLNTN